VGATGSVMMEVEGAAGSVITVVALAKGPAKLMIRMVNIVIRR